MEIIVYMGRCILMLLITWLGVRILGKKSIAQMTSYDLAGLLLLTTAAAEPIVYKIPSKAGVGVVAIAAVTVFIGWLSLKKTFYNVDTKPSIVIVNGKVDRDQLRSNKMNLPFLLSLLRQKGYSKISDVEYAIIEPNGNLSVIPKSQQRPVKTSDLLIQTQYEGLSMPLIVEGELSKENLRFAGLNEEWLTSQIKKSGANHIRQVYYAELDTEGSLYIDRYENENGQAGQKPPLI